MKIRRYGYSEFRESTTMNFAVMVPLYEYEGEGEERHVAKITYAFVTDIWVNGRREWKAENKKEAYLWSDRKSAQDFCIGLAYNFTAGYVVEVLDGMEMSNNW